MMDMLMKKLRLGILLTVMLGGLVALWHRSALQAWASGLSSKAQSHVGQAAPELPSSVRTLDGASLKLATLKGKVVLLHFWTFGCSNCKRMLPRYAEWGQALGSQGLSIVGVHTPELDFERDVAKLKEFVKTNRVAWPVVIDPDYAVWERYGVEAWPTIVLVDRAGIVRSVFVGDDHAAEIDASLRKLL